jgi:hypothetical protein
MRITLTLFEEIERLLKQDHWSQRKIARETGVSRSTVNNIARGYRPRWEDSPSDVQPTGPLVRCPGCGGRVFLPCLLCRVRELKEQDRQLCNPRATGRERRGF